MLKIVAGVSKTGQKELGSNSKKTSHIETNKYDSLKYRFENAKAVLEINKILNGTRYNAQDVWRLINDDNTAEPEFTKS